MSWVSTTISRLYTFVAGQNIKSAQMNAELNQLLTQHNNTVQDLSSISATTDGASGADSVGAGPMYSGDVSTATVMGKLKHAYQQMVNVVLGQVPDGSITSEKIPDGEITPAKLAFDPATQAEMDAHSSDSTKHVAKDGTLQTGLNAQRINGLYMRNNNGTMEWSTDNTNWNAVGGSNGFEFGLPWF